MKRAHLQTFLAVARLQSFRKSSAFLNTTQSNVSARIAALEHDLGAKLFHRDGVSVQLTATGRDLIPYAQNVIRSLEELEAAAGAVRFEAGTLRLALSETLVGVLLPSFMQRFSERFPLATVEITVESTANQRQQLLDRVVDVAFLMGPVSEHQVSNVPLLRLPLVWAMHPDHPVASAERIGVSDLKRHPIMSYTRNSRPYTELRSALIAAGVERPRLFESNVLSATLAMTQALLGVATLPALVAKPHVVAGQLKILPCDVPLTDLKFTASYLTEGGMGLAEEAAQLAQAIAAELIAAAESRSLIAKFDR